MATLSPAELQLLHRYWQAANYLAVGQIYLLDNVLLRQPLQKQHIKPRLLGHWGTSPGLNLIYVHLNRLIRRHNTTILYICGPGHGAPAILANTYLEGTYSEVYPSVTKDLSGLEAFFRQFSTPGGIPSHVSPHTPGSIHEGGELGYSLAHAFGAAFDNPDLLVACVVGDGEAETGPLEGSWKSIHFLNPVRDGAVLPILHLNGYKIAGPTVLARQSDDTIKALMEGHGYEVFFVEGDDPLLVHEQFAQTLETIYTRIHKIQQQARQQEIQQPPRWPMIVLRTPKGWTCPKQWNDKPLEGSFRSHQVPLDKVTENADQLALLEEWMRSYHPENLFDEKGALLPELAALAPPGDKRMSAVAHANGGRLLQDLQLPDFTQYALPISSPAVSVGMATRQLGQYLRDVFALNQQHKNFRLFCPDETASNKLDAVFEATNRCSSSTIINTDDHLSPDGRVMEVLSEHLCQGWLEGYLLTGRHGFFPCYEAFITIIDSMFNQHAKWLKTCNELPWRKPIASLNYLLTSHAWRQDHNGYSHQGPGFIDTVVNKKSTVIRLYFPPDANTLLSVTDHCLRSKNYVNVIVAGKQSELQYLTMEEAIPHCKKGAGIWHWAGHNDDGQPDIILACAGDVPTMEAVAAAWLLAKEVPHLKVRFINVVDLMALSPRPYHPHGLPDNDFNDMFTTGTPVIFAFHGYVRVIHDLIHGRPHPARFHVRGFMEEGTTTTPFDMVVLNNVSRYHLAIEALKRSIPAQEDAQKAIEHFESKLTQHHAYIRTHLRDMPEIENWNWKA
ncbi:xylulose-5-phosphate/fructose-6-phosphate phosphoketolase [Filimonas lacunae]|uniref:Probable phosphoketolase n=1 Tax=Filimonas lacunae TaxID=477680 RepID=A0A173MJT6_9BACT|nr:phosphoketolase family protein [Filimonas lacunae]BAV07895.1 xylulose-5-phosphate phosphoketolase [Filimonas lacunae]SIT06127.1 xylulose-5-phosphate/fructose-6-phosphate phosphoketolase [Filimonas lacunae]